MDSRQLRYFAAIHDSGSLSAAAEREHVAVSALSYHLANLESELGTPLFERAPRGMVPTAAGVRLRGHAARVLDALADARRDMSEAASEVSGDISVGMAYSAVKAIGIPLARRVLTDHPRLNLAISESLSGATLLHLTTADVDLALIYNPPATPMLRSIPLLEEPMGLVGRPEIIGASADPIAVDALLELPLIQLRQATGWQALFENRTLARQIDARARLRMNSVPAIAEALSEGLGCAIATRLFLREGLRSGVLHWRPIEGVALTRRLYLCEMADRPPGLARETVRDLLRTLVAEAVRTGVWGARIL